MSRRMASPHLFKQYLNNDLRSVGNELHIWVWKTLDFFRYRHRGPTNLSCRRSKKRRTHCRILQHGEMRMQEKTANWKLRTEDATHKLNLRT